MMARGTIGDKDRTYLLERDLGTECGTHADFFKSERKLCCLGSRANGHEAESLEVGRLVSS